MTRTLIFLAILLTTIAPLSAQEPDKSVDYSIRINSATNLRANPTTSADHIDTVPAGTQLNVTHEEGNWLQVTHREQNVWMANWLGHTRLAAPLPPQPHYPDFDPYTLFPDCTPAQFQPYAEWLLRINYLQIKFIVELFQDDPFSTTSYLFYNVSRTPDTAVQNFSLPPCRQAVELRTLTHHRLANAILFIMTMLTNNQDTVDEIHANQRKISVRIHELTPVIDINP